VGIQERHPTQELERRGARGIGGGGQTLRARSSARARVQPRARKNATSYGEKILNRSAIESSLGARRDFSPDFVFWAFVIC
jgi:hypothetical protein